MLIKKIKSWFKIPLFQWTIFGVFFGALILVGLYNFVGDSTEEVNWETIEEKREQNIQSEIDSLMEK